MARYLIIESRDPFESRDVGFLFELAVGLARAGNEVTVFLVQNGVLPARPGPRATELAAMAAAKVEILADEFSLRERGVTTVVPGVRPSPIDVVVDRMAAGARALWH